MIALLIFLLRLLTLPSRPKCQLAAENAALKRQLDNPANPSSVIASRSLTTIGSFSFSSIRRFPSSPQDNDENPAGNAAALASRRLPSLLALEIQKLRRTATHLSGIAGVDPAYEP